MQNNIYKLILCFSLLLQSCVPTLPKYKNTPSEEIIIPGNFPSRSNESGKVYKFKSPDGDLEVVEKSNKEESIAKQNWKVFFNEDYELASLIEIALENNQEINILNQEINIANNEVSARQGEYLPKVGVGASYDYDKVGEYTSQGKNDANSGVDKRLLTRQFGLNTSWEVDIWKKLRNSAKSAYYEYLASVEGKNFAVTRLVAEVSGNYYELVALDNQLEIIKQYIKTLKQAKEVVELQKAAGRSNSLAVKRFAAEVLKNQSREYKIQQQIIITENRLNTLLGRVPQHIKRTKQKFIEITATKEINLGIPAALLENRPDIKQASLKIEAAKLNLKSVKARFYPSLTIDAALGYQAFNSTHLLDTPESLFYNVAGGITAPLLNRKAIKADYFSANSKQIQAVYNYEQTFIKAFAEVSNQLSSLNNYNKIYNTKLEQTKALEESLEISNILFKAARIDYLESLLTRRDYLESQIELIEAKQQQILSYINLYKALGGGWRE